MVASGHAKDMQMQCEACGFGNTPATLNGVIRTARTSRGTWDVLIPARPNLESERLPTERGTVIASYVRNV